MLGHALKTLVLTPKTSFQAVSALSSQLSQEADLCQGVYCMPDVCVSTVGFLLRLGVSIAFLCLSFYSCSNLDGSCNGFALSDIF